MHTFLIDRNLIEQSTLWALHPRLSLSNQTFLISNAVDKVGTSLRLEVI
jgi:hypothetical protein